MNLTPEEFADLVVGAIKIAVDGPKIGGRLAQLEARLAELEQTTLKAATTWEPGKAFAKNDTIQRDGSLWQCVETHGAGEAFNHAYWKLLIKRGKDGRDLRETR